MALLQKSANLFSHRLPKVIGPGAHTFIDYAMAGMFFAAGILFWRRHKSAALSALLCGSGTLLNGLFTDYPGGVVRAISFDTHAKIDAGLAGLAAIVPELMGFKKDEQARFFTGTAVAGTLAAGFTGYHGETEENDAHDEQRWRRREAA